MLLHCVKDSFKLSFVISTVQSIRQKYPPTCIRYASESPNTSENSRLNTTQRYLDIQSRVTYDGYLVGSEKADLSSGERERAVVESGDGQ